MKSSPIRTTLKTARGLGAAHEGTHHFWVQRLTALALIPLSVWFMVEVVTLLIGTDHTVAANWFHDPIAALLMAIFVAALFWHSKLGMQVIIEDYVHSEGKKLAMLMFSNGLNLLLCAASLLAIAHLHFNGT